MSEVVTPPVEAPVVAPVAPVVEPAARPAAIIDPAAPAVEPAPAEPKPGDPPAAPVDSWRARMAGDDKDALKRLERFSTEADFYKSFKSLETKLSSGEFKRDLPENATDEEKATWRKERGIPDKPEGYIEKITLPKGLVLGEADKPLATEFAAAAADANMTPAQYSRMVEQYYAIQDKAKAAQEDADAAFYEEAQAALRDKFGADFRREISAVNNLVASMPETLSGRLLSGRMADGRKVGDDPEMVAWLASHARELNPVATLVPAGSSDPTKAANARLEEISQIRRADPDKYDRDKNLQREELELIQATEKLKARAA